MPLSVPVTLEKHSEGKRKLRIAVLGIRGFPDVQGGVEKHCEEVYSRLADARFDITVLARKNYVKKHPTLFKGVKIFPLWAPRSKHFEAIFHTALGILWVAWRRREFDILHLHAIGPSLLAFAARKLKLRLVITHHGQDYDRKKWGFLAKKMLRFGEYLAARYAYMVIAVSMHIQQLLLERYESAAVYIPNGVTAPKRRSSEGVQRRFGLKKGKFILAVGRLVPEKGFHVLLRAYSKLNTDWNLVIVGEADHEDAYSIALKNEAKQIRGVVMTGFQTGDALAELYSHAGLFVLPSFHEGLPIVALEAMSYGLPLLVSNIPANREFAAGEEMFPVGDAEALANRLHSFLHRNTRSVSPNLFQYRWDCFKNDYSWDSVAAKTADVYEAVAKMPTKMGVHLTRRLR